MSAVAAASDHSTPSLCVIRIVSTVLKTNCRSPKALNGAVTREGPSAVHSTAALVVRTAVAAHTLEPVDAREGGCRRRKTVGDSSSPARRVHGGGRKRTKVQQEKIHTHQGHPHHSRATGSSQDPRPRLPKQNRSRCHRERCPGRWPRAGGRLLGPLIRRVEGLAKEVVRLCRHRDQIKDIRERSRRPRWETNGRCSKQTHSTRSQQCAAQRDQRGGKRKSATRERERGRKRHASC